MKPNPPHPVPVPRLAGAARPLSPSPAPSRHSARAAGRHPAGPGHGWDGNSMIIYGYRCETGIWMFYDQV